mmetsp:Transcript_6461/g.12853  ORF Transcript_6461/g.12853 Transcript_6461/m.12853 type:complete len:385 (+) Transcript_6461:832-1986(+)
MRVQTARSGCLSWSVTVGVVSRDAHKVVRSRRQTCQGLEPRRSAAQISQEDLRWRSESAVRSVLDLVLRNCCSSIVGWGRPKDPELRGRGNLKGNSSRSTRDHGRCHGSGTSLGQGVTLGVDCKHASIVARALGEPPPGARHLQSASALRVSLPRHKGTTSDRHRGSRRSAVSELDIFGQVRIDRNNEVAAPGWRIIHKGDPPNVSAVSIRSVPVHYNSIGDDRSQILELALNTSALLPLGGVTVGISVPAVAVNPTGRRSSPSSVYPLRNNSSMASTSINVLKVLCQGNGGSTDRCDLVLVRGAIHGSASVALVESESISLEDVVLNRGGTGSTRTQDPTAGTVSERKAIENFFLSARLVGRQGDSIVRNLISSLTDTVGRHC